MASLKYACYAMIILFSACSYHARDTNGCVAAYGEISFENSIQFIIAEKCSAAGCHVPGSPVGNFMVYDELITAVENGIFQTAVIDLNIMPPASSEQLNDEELKQIQCWLEAGYPEK